MAHKRSYLPNSTTNTAKITGKIVDNEMFLICNKHKLKKYGFSRQIKTESFVTNCFPCFYRLTL